MKKWRRKGDTYAERHQVNSPLTLHLSKQTRDIVLIFNEREMAQWLKRSALQLAAPVA